jgi:Na+/H+ antiporter NhaD/arsenite permease-like protein
VSDPVYWLTWTIFSATYLGLALGKVPGVRIDRAGIAFVGAALVLISGVLSLADATSPQSIDFKTLLLLFGMMIVVGALRLSGVFQRLIDAAAGSLATPRALLAMTIALGGLLSAFLINDVVCIALTPLVLQLARRLKCDPLPHLIGLATAANVGSTGTITGNPQNIYIGVHSGIPYLRFAARLLPVALLGLALNYLIVWLVYRQRLAAPARRERRPEDAFQNLDGPDALAGAGRRHSRLLFLQIKSIAVTLAAVCLFFAGFPLELVALGAAAIVLLDRIKPEKLYREVDWSLLVMFTGLFVVVHAFQVHVVRGWNVESWTWLLARPVDMLSLVSLGLSNLVSNVPAVLLLEPVVQAVPDASRESAWLALAMSSTFAGNLTILGSVANLIVVESARRHGVEIRFRDYLKVGIPLTLATTSLGIAWLTLVRY